VIYGAQEMIQGIDVVFLHSPKKELSNWYADILGLEIGYSDDTWIEFRMGETRFAVEYVGFTRSVVEKQAIMVSFRVADIHMAVEILAARGVCFYPSKAEAIFEAGSSLVATFQDPAGNWVQLSERKRSTE
jgi:predicted enzyme related to lactoylglutathione lyase